jgi:hypothetical protein
MSPTFIYNLYAKTQIDTNAAINQNVDIVFATFAFFVESDNDTFTPRRPASNQVTHIH